MQFFLCQYRKYTEGGKTESEHYPLPETENIYNTQCPILYAMEIIGQKWKLPILWYIADKQVIRYNELKRKVVGIVFSLESIKARQDPC